MQNNRALGWALLVVGGVLVLIGVGWARAGFYESQIAPLFLLLIAGGAAAFVGGRMLRKPQQETSTPVQWRTPADKKESDSHES